MIAMTCDHAGLQLLPQLSILRIIGRLALPVYAYMIAEGCRHTRSIRNYLLRMVLLAAVCQAVYFVAMGSLYQCILVTFSLSICLIWSIDHALQTRTLYTLLAAAGIFCASVFLCLGVPQIVPGFYIDYGIWGVLLPVLVYFGTPKLFFLSLGLTALAVESGGIQWWGFAALPLLALYSGARGTLPIGKLFYLYYPAHLVIIYLISLL